MQELEFPAIIFYLFLCLDQFTFVYSTRGSKLFQAVNIDTYAAVSYQIPSTYKSCSYITSESTALFINPHFPHGETESVNCEMSMVTELTSCAVRIDFHYTNLTPAIDTACHQDTVMILVKPTTEAGYNSPLCGYLKGYSKEDACGFHKINRPNGQDRQPKFPVRHHPQKYRRLNQQYRQVPFTSTRVHTVNGTFYDARVFMGTEASVNEFPWIAALLLDGSLHCAASLVAHQWLLTAGHCINMASSETPPIDRLTVILGVHQFSAKEPQRIVRKLKHIYRHPSYFGVNYDIAVLELAENVQYTAAIQPICLPARYGAIYSSTHPIIAGWGLRASGMLSDVLMVTPAPLISRRSCQALWREKETALTSYMLCTEPRGCNGDSGGPLMAKDENELVRIIGITSFGAPICGDPTLPDVFVKVEYFLKWITTVISQRR